MAVVLNEDATQSLAREGLTVPRAEVVWRLHHHGRATQRVLADALNVTPRNITGLVDGLVESGFVSREPHPADRRATLVTLTPHGARIAHPMDRDHEARAALLLGTCPTASSRRSSRGSTTCWGASAMRSTRRGGRR